MKEYCSIPCEDRKSTSRHITLGVVIGFGFSIFMYNLVSFFYSIIILATLGENVTLSLRGRTTEMPDIGYILLITMVFITLLIYALNNLGFKRNTKFTAYICFSLFIIGRFIYVFI